MWNSSRGFVAGIFMQGGFMFVSDVMLRTMFSKWTAWAECFVEWFDLLRVCHFGCTNAGIYLADDWRCIYVLWFPLLATT